MLWAKGRDPNLDVSGPLSRLIGLHRDFFTPLFTMSGVGGWTAHIVEQRTSNTLFGRWPPTPTRRAPTYRPAVGPYRPESHRGALAARRVRCASRRKRTVGAEPCRPQSNLAWSASTTAPAVTTSANLLPDNVIRLTIGS
jgi:hypothetical protein